MELFDSRYFRGQGKFFIGNRDANGEPSGLIFIGNVAEADLSPNIDTSEKVEQVTGSNAIASSFIRSSEFNLTLSLSSIKPDHLAEALHGAVTVVAGASVTDEPHTAYLDKFTRLTYNKISAVTITGTGGTPTYVAGTDYIVHADEGMIEFISGGTITNGTAVLIDYTHAAQHHIKIAPHNTEKYLVFAGINSADNDKQTRCEMYKVKINPGSIPMITDDAVDMQLTGRLLLDSLRTAGDQFYSWKTED